MLLEVLLVTLHNFYNLKYKAAVLRKIPLENGHRNIEPSLLEGAIAVKRFAAVGQ